MKGDRNLLPLFGRHQPINLAQFFSIAEVKTGTLHFFSGALEYRWHQPVNPSALIISS